MSGRRRRLLPLLANAAMILAAFRRQLGILQRAGAMGNSPNKSVEANLYLYLRTEAGGNLTAMTSGVIVRS